MNFGGEGEGDSRFLKIQKKNSYFLELIFSQKIMILAHESEYIDFEEEVQEFIKKKYVEAIIIQEKNKEACYMKLETLEKEIFMIRCSVSKGIEVRSIYD